VLRDNAEAKSPGWQLTCNEMTVIVDAVTAGGADSSSGAYAQADAC